ncbi:MAG: ATP-dependent chaperone ClpB [Bacteroidia bacterium]|nr:MAG: ATP-dependent chaperone ClpB [Bacteroidia bacterium]
MNLNNFTIQSREVIQKAFRIAESAQNQSVETIHLLQSMMQEAESVFQFICNKLAVNIKNLQAAANSLHAACPKVSGAGESYFSSTAMSVLQKALQYAEKNGDQYVSVETLLLALLSGGDDTAQLLKDAGITEKNLKQAVAELRKGQKNNSENAEDSFDALNRFALNLNQMARKGKLDPVIGRDEEIRRVLQILSRRTKNNPILIGEPGVGKTAIAEGIAHRIINGDVPENLKSKEIYSLDMGALIAGAKYKGEFEERLKSVVKEVIASNGEIVLFIDEIHTLVGAGKGEGAMDAANILKPALARGELKAVGATTLNEYQKYFEKDKALERRFQKVLIDEPNVEDAVSILRGLKEKYETHHKVRIKDEAIIAAVQLSHRYISDRFLPDKAIDLIDEAAAKMRLEMNSVPVEIDEIRRRIRQLEIERQAVKRENNDAKTQILNKEIAEKQEELDRLNAKWQSEKEIIQEIQQCKKNIEEYKFQADRAEREGLYEKVAELRYGKIKEEENRLENGKQKLKTLQSSGLLMKEEVDSEDIAEIISNWTNIPVKKLVQSEKEKLLHLEEELHRRVIGQEEAIQAVSDAVRRNKAGMHDPKKPIGSFIFMGSTGVGKTELAKSLAEFLFDDEQMMTRIDMSEYQEKHSVSRLIGAPPGYVGYEEGGQLTEAVRRKPYSVILLDEIEKAHPDVFNILLQVLDDGILTDNKGHRVNFKNTIVIMTSNIGSHIIQEAFGEMKDSDYQKVIEETKSKVFALLKQNMRPELLNRIDEIIMFTPLNKQEIRDIVQLQFAGLQKMLSGNNIQAEITDKALDYLAKKGYDPQFGARPVKRILQKELLNDLAKAVLADQIRTQSQILIDAEASGITFGNVG